MKKTIVLCADDYGQAPAISQGILSLIKLKRLSATTCMVNSPFWLEDAKWLQPYQADIEIGLHFNLTEGKALSPLFIETYGENLFSLRHLMSLALFRKLNEAAIIAECHAQIDAFITGMSSPSITGMSNSPSAFHPGTPPLRMSPQPIISSEPISSPHPEASSKPLMSSQRKLGSIPLPQFLDGHQHIHQFPIIREALIKVYKDRFPHQKTYIRWVSGQITLKETITAPKKLAIFAMGSFSFKKLLNKETIPHNTSFSGIYDFSKANDYPTLFRGFLSEIKHQGLIMCHPGLSIGEGAKDPIFEARIKEYDYLKGSQFLKDCEAEGVALGGLY